MASNCLAMIGKVVAIVLLCLLPFALPCGAEETAEAHAGAIASDSAAQTGREAEGFNWRDYEEPPVKRAEENPFVSGLSFLLKFGAVVGLIYGTAWLYRRGMIVRGLPSQQGESGMRVLESMPLRGAQTLHLVEIGSRTLVVGSNGKETMVKLAEWEGKAPRFEHALDEAERGESEPFSLALDETLRRVRRQDQS